MGKPQSNFQYRTIFGVPLIAGNGLGLGEVAEPNIELKNKTLKLKKND